MLLIHTNVIYNLQRVVCERHDCQGENGFDVLDIFGIGNGQKTNRDQSTKDEQGTKKIKIQKRYYFNIITLLY